MSIIYLLIGISIFMATLFLLAFLWSVKSGQFEDSYTPSVRMLFDDTVKEKKENKNQNKSE